MGRVESSGSVLEGHNRYKNLVSDSPRNSRYVAAIDVVSFRGHPNIRATHETTFEITKETYLTPKGDCIIGVSADKGLADLSRELKQVVKSEASLVLLLLVDELGEHDLVLGRGDPQLELSDEKRIIVRKSTYVSRDTLAVSSSKSAADLKRSLIENLKRGVSARAYIIGLTTP